MPSMTRTRYHIVEDEYPYFMTCTVVGWLAVFTRPDAVQIVLDSWKHLQQHKQFQLLGYVILENHLHLYRPRTGPVAGDAELQVVDGPAVD
jgi:putative transposase